MNVAALRSTPALLKLDLYCQGIRLDDSCLVQDDGRRPILRTRAGLVSGLEAILPGGLWTNVPVSEPFAQRSPYVLHRSGAGRYWIWRHGEPVVPVELSPRPDWYDETLPSGKPMTRIGTLQGSTRCYASCARRAQAPASPTSTSTPATTTATSTSTSSSPTAATSKPRRGCSSACRRRRTATSRATTSCAIGVNRVSHAEYGLDLYL